VDGACSTHEKDEKLYKILVRKPDGKRPLGIPRRRREGNIRMDLKKITWEGVNWTHPESG
jgi:hypothetical protein